MNVYQINISKQETPRDETTVPASYDEITTAVALLGMRITEEVDGSEYAFLAEITDAQAKYVEENRYLQVQVLMPGNGEDPEAIIIIEIEMP